MYLLIKDCRAILTFRYRRESPRHLISRPHGYCTCTLYFRIFPSSLNTPYGVLGFWNLSLGLWRSWLASWIMEVIALWHTEVHYMSYQSTEQGDLALMADANSGWSPVFVTVRYKKSLDLWYLYTHIYVYMKCICKPVFQKRQLRRSDFSTSRAMTAFVLFQIPP